MFLELDSVGRTFVLERRKHTEELCVLEGISFGVAEGSFVAICGPSGCGKSTLLRLIHGLQQPDAGEIRVRGERVTAPSLDRGMVFQHHNLMPWRTVIRNVELGLEAQKLSKAEARSRAERWLDKVGLSDFASYYPAQLSGGMQQRVGLARALAIDPAILLMDEPFGALDAQTRVLLQEELERIWEANAKTVVFITHDIEEALFLADRVIVMSARPGRIIADIAVDAARPRREQWRAAPEFAQLKGEIWKLLRSGQQEALLEEVSP
ncbi:ABC transporter ATP-binding protein [Solirubrobacter sp. CPCC 204708]|uniref:ABC transporter ATP-binding protein n=1 Tax=Solirubrobacter deserti TaxID=2282478 RepID=A0ABT4RFB1_9ACTN|nr:ABC transporter ATP-binding protein [Solirubrobacter deserti]MBE2319489.1 ABC transporter ATP-binding protein [Solirubrobacter deserti]MDA0137224.1 ABC transporter ATP-binding protein [Solirubrobacter deserti]